MSRAIPPLLSPYLTLPSESSLILLTSVLGAGTNWLVLRYLSSLLSAPGALIAGKEVGDGNDNGNGDRSGKGETEVLFLSFMRDMSFWREGARKINLDLDKLTRQKRFLFIDGLTSLYLPQTGPLPPGSGTLLKDPSIPSITRVLTQAITTLSSSSPNSKIILILDSPDFLLASSPTSETYNALTSFLLTLRDFPSIHSTIMGLSIDTPLLNPSPSSSLTPLETHTAAFAIQTAHQADLIISTRLLDTGAARDVSGVLRITAGGEVGGVSEREVEERELLYFVAGDGGVRVFERGQ